MSEQEILTTREAADFLGCAPTSLKVYVHRKKLTPVPHDPFPGQKRTGDYHFTRQELEQFKKAPRKKRSDAGKPRTRGKRGLTIM